MKALISVENIRAYRPISKEVNQDRLNVYILEAQLADLKPVLGEQLYWDLINKFQATGDPLYTAYNELLVGKAYTPAGYLGAIQYEGIIPMLSYYTLARYFEGNPIHATKFGLVQKNNENLSEPVSPQVMTKAVDGMRSMALAYQKGVQLFLESNVSTYALYKQVDPNKIINSTGVKFIDL